MTQTQRWIYQDTAPDGVDLGRLVDTLSSRPSAIETVLRDSPRTVPGLLQEALRRGSDLAVAIENSLWAEVERGGGVGRAFDALFLAALALEGEQAATVRLRVRALVVERDRRLRKSRTRARSETSHSHDGKDRLLDLADRDPAAARLYVHFREQPAKAAQQLLNEAVRAPALFHRHVPHLAGWMRNVDAADRFADEVRTLRGPIAERVKRYVLRELFGVARAAAASHRAARDADGATQAHVERIVPSVARLVADPDVAWLLVGGAADVPGLPSMRSICELLLDRGFSLAVQVEVRLALVYGAVELLRQTVEDRAHASEAIEVVTELLGATARVQRAIGLEDNVAMQLARIAGSLADVVPGARAKAAAKLCVLLGFTGDTEVRCGDAEIAELCRAVAPDR